MLKSYDVFIFYIFHNCSNLNLGSSGAYYHKSNNLGVRGIGAEIKRKLPTNNIFTTFTVSLLPVNISFCDFSCVSLYLRPTSAADGSVFYRAPKERKKQKTKQIYRN